MSKGRPLGTLTRNLTMQHVCVDAELADAVQGSLRVVPERFYELLPGVLPG